MYPSTNQDGWSCWRAVVVTTIVTVILKDANGIHHLGSRTMGATIQSLAQFFSGVKQ